jgi:hypothetical protein
MERLFLSGFTDRLYDGGVGGDSQEAEAQQTTVSVRSILSCRIERVGQSVHADALAAARLVWRACSSLTFVEGPTSTP